MSPVNEKSTPPSPPHEEAYLLYSDGACSGNPGPGGWAAIVSSPDGQVKELAGRAISPTTNNQMEIQGALEGLKYTLDDLSKKTLKKVSPSTPVLDFPAASTLPPTSTSHAIIVYSDSSYLLNGITKWVYGWRRRNWSKSDGGLIQNLDLWKKLLDLVEKLPPIDWRYVPGHAQFTGNERCDAMAVAMSQDRFLTLYEGPQTNYPYSIWDLPPLVPIPEHRGTHSTLQPPPKIPGFPCYLVYLEGKLHRHPTWSSCEAQVRGRSGVRFKKISSPQEEAQILNSWGLKSEEKEIKKQKG